MSVNRTSVRLSLGVWTLVAATLVAAGGARAGVPDDDFDWVTIGDVNNAPYNGRTTNSPSPNFPAGRGSVGYVYRMSRLEITTNQWLAFVNTFTTQSDSMSFFIDEPNNWGGRPDLSYDGPGRLYELDPNIPNAGMLAVGGIDWRDAARYCNWLHNGRPSAVASLTTGAYDTSTWGPGPRPGSTFTDAERHLPGARFWIPTLDEYLKAAHYDPDKGGEGVGGWWLYDNRSDTEPVSGPPGVGQTSAGTGDYRIPLGSYPQTTSAYGLLDLSGGASEWLEDWVRYGVPGEAMEYRFWDGNNIWYPPLDPGQTPDLAYNMGGTFPDQGLVTLGLRLASIPGPSVGAAWLVFMALVGGSTRRRR